MAFYVNIKNGQINGTSELNNSKYWTDDYFQIEVTEEIYNDIEKYIYKDGEIVINPNYEAEQEQKERERIGNLFLTGADVERGIYQAKGMDFDDILAFVMANPPQGLDIKALRIELKANNFYRGNPYVNAVGALLGFTSEQLDKFFETNDYTVLLPPVEPEQPVEELEDESDINS
jgi:hypothetical protein